MSEEVMPVTLPRPPRRWPHRLGGWLGELVTVFVGVYAAFFLNYRATHRQERQRREQLLTWVEERYQGVLDNARTQTAALGKIVADFDAKTAAGQMPEIKPIGWVGDYDAADGIGLLQTSLATHAQQRSDALILPNRGKDPTVFYDPATHRLRESYDWVPKAYEDLRKSFEDLEGDCTKLLAQVHAERGRAR